MTVGINFPDSSLHLPGTAKATMPGIECIYTINGLAINDLSTIDRYELTLISGFDDAEIRQGEDPIPGRDGAYPVDGIYGARALNFEGVIKAGDVRLLRDMQDLLKEALMPLTETAMIIDYPWDGTLQKSIAVKKWDKLVMTETQTDALPRRKFQFTLRASNPALTSTFPKSIALVPNVISNLGRIYNKTYDDVYGTPLDAQFYPVAGGGISSSDTVTAVNNGNYRAFPTLRFTGAMDDITLTNSANGQVIKFTQPVADGDQIFYDVGRAVIFDDQGNNRSDMIDTTSDQLQLDGTNSASHGINTLTLSVSNFGSSAEFSVSWFDTFM